MLNREVQVQEAPSISALFSLYVGRLQFLCPSLGIFNIVPSYNV